MTTQMKQLWVMESYLDGKKYMNINKH